METVWAIASSFVALVALLLLIGSEFWFYSLSEMRRLKENQARLGEALVDGGKFPVIKVGGSDYRGEKLRTFFLRQLGSVSLIEDNSNDRFRTLGATADILTLRVRTHKRLLREIRGLSAVVFMAFALGAVWTVVGHGLSWKVLLETPSAAVAIEDITLCFLLYRLYYEYSETRDLNDGPSVV